MEINGIEERKKDSPMKYYLIAFIVGLAAFIVLLIAFKLGAWVLPILAQYWLLIVGGVIAVMIVRKIIKRKRIKKIEYSN